MTNRELARQIWAQVGCDEDALERALIAAAGAAGAAERARCARLVEEWEHLVVWREGLAQAIRNPNKERDDATGR